MWLIAVLLSDQRGLKSDKKESVSSPEGKGKYKLLQARLRVSETAKVGDTIECLNCGLKMQKRAEIHKYCSNNRKPRMDGNNCADEYNHYMKSKKGAA